MCCGYFGEANFPSVVCCAASPRSRQSSPNWRRLQDNNMKLWEPAGAEQTELETGGVGAGFTETGDGAKQQLIKL